MASKILKDVNVKHQIDHSACWASATAAVANKIKPGASSSPTTQEGLVSSLAKQRSKTGGFKTEDALEHVGLISNKLRGLSKKGFEDAISGEIDADRPCVIGIKVANDALKWKGGEAFKMGHAVVCYGYSGSTSQFFLKDPARKGDNRIIVTYQEMSDGFVYMGVDELGPKTRSKLDVSGGQTSIVMKIDSVVTAKMP